MFRIPWQQQHRLLFSSVKAPPHLMAPQKDALHPILLSFSSSPVEEEEEGHPLAVVEAR